MSHFQNLREIFSEIFWNFFSRQILIWRKGCAPTQEEKYFCSRIRADLKFGFASLCQLTRNSKILSSSEFVPCFELMILNLFSFFKILLVDSFLKRMSHRSVALESNFQNAPLRPNFVSKLTEKFPKKVHSLAWARIYCIWLYINKIFVYVMLLNKVFSKFQELLLAIFEEF